MKKVLKLTSIFLSISFSVLYTLKAYQVYPHVQPKFNASSFFSMNTAEARHSLDMAQSDPQAALILAELQSRSETFKLKLQQASLKNLAKFEERTLINDLVLAVPRCEFVLFYSLERAEHCYQKVLSEIAGHPEAEVRRQILENILSLNFHRFPNASTQSLLQHLASLNAEQLHVSAPIVKLAQEALARNNDFENYAHFEKLKIKSSNEDFLNVLVTSTLVNESFEHSPNGLRQAFTQSWERIHKLKHGALSDVAVDSLSRYTLDKFLDKALKYSTNDQQELLQLFDDRIFSLLKLKVQIKNLAGEVNQNTHNRSPAQYNVRKNHLSALLAEQETLFNDFLEQEQF